MHVSEEATRKRLVVVAMLEDSEDGLDEEEDYERDAEAGVGWDPELDFVSTSTQELGKRLRRTFLVMLVRWMPSPKPAIKQSRLKAWRMPCRRALPTTRMKRAPIGNSRTTVTPMMMPCAF